MQLNCMLDYQIWIHILLDPIVPTTHNHIFRHVIRSPLTSNLGLPDWVISSCLTEHAQPEIRLRLIASLHPAGPSSALSGTHTFEGRGYAGGTPHAIVYTRVGTHLRTFTDEDIPISIVTSGYWFFSCLLISYI